jgi:hypothetical protein
MRNTIILLELKNEDQTKLPSMQWRKTIAFFNLKKEHLLKLELIHWSRLAPPQIATVILLLIEIRWWFRVRQRKPN